LSPHADKVSETYSGGNKRKLSLGIALIGNPKVLFIDEASSGMDPATRRKMWDLIADAAKNRAVILTTHSMEEAEALCNNVAIMINGRIRCLGGVQHLKNKFLGGYSLTISCDHNSTNAAIDHVESIVHELLPYAKLSERHGRFLKFEVPVLDKSSTGAKSLGSLFSELQRLKDNADIALNSYSVSQCSLEQVFINLVREETINNLEQEDNDHNSPYSSSKKSGDGHDSSNVSIDVILPNDDHNSGVNKKFNSDSDRNDDSIGNKTVLGIVAKVSDDSNEGNEI